MPKTDAGKLDPSEKAGGTIILADRNKPFAEFRPLPKERILTGKRELGQLAGQVQVTDAFFSADEGIEADFIGKEI